MGPKPGYYSSSVALAIGTGPYAKLSTFSPPTDVVAGNELMTIILARDYINEIWKGDSSELYTLTASKSLGNGANVVFPGSIYVTNTEKGQYLGKLTLTETGV